MPGSLGQKARAHIFRVALFAVLNGRMSMAWRRVVSYDGRLVGYAQIFLILTKSGDVSAIYKINSAHSWDSMNFAAL